MRRKRWLKVPFFILLFIVILTAVSYITMLLWNALIPALFSGPVITFWQAAGLLILSKILLGGFHKRGHHRHPGEMWKRKWKAKMDSMTPEEKEKFRKRCHPYFYEEEPTGTQNTADSAAENDNKS